MFHFDQHTFNDDTGELTGPAGAQRLQPKPAQLLGMLLRAAGDLVEREAIRERLWPDTNVDFESGLNTCVRQIRAALDDSGGNPAWLETLPKRGYRFTISVEGAQLPSATRAAAAEPASASAGMARSAEPSSTRFGRWAAAIAVIAVSIVVWQIVGSSGEDAADDPARLAVVPFFDPDTEAVNDFNRALVEGFVVALTNAAPDTFVVIGPATTAELWSAGLPPAEIADRLDAEFLLRGGHRESDHMTFVEILVSPGAEHLFAQRFEIDEAQPADAPQEIVDAIVAAIAEAR